MILHFQCPKCGHLVLGLLSMRERPVNPCPQCRQPMHEVVPEVNPGPQYTQPMREVAADSAAPPRGVSMNVRFQCPKCGHVALGIFSMRERPVNPCPQCGQPMREVVPDSAVPTSAVELPITRPIDGGMPATWLLMGWWDFEIAVLLAFENQGYEAEATLPAADGGLDGLIAKGEDRHGLQCKHYEHDELVRVHEVREFVGALVLSGLGHGYFVTTGRYTDAAVKAANGTIVKVDLLGIDELARMGQGLTLTPQIISAAKERWGVPEEPPEGMHPQKGFRTQ